MVLVFFWMHSFVLANGIERLNGEWYSYGSADLFPADLPVAPLLF
jgi:hypothetical protein